MDDALKNSLWNVAHGTLWSTISPGQTASYVWHGQLLIALWSDHFHLPTDKLHPHFSSALAAIRDRYMKSSWESVYDFIEFVAHYPGAEVLTARFIRSCNSALEKHVSAYRFVGGTLAPITSEEEIATIECGLSHGEKYKPMVTHLETALARLADRPTPDARNSIKESISAVESVCQIITGDPKATLGKALKQIGLHSALEGGFSKLYGYTSDADGIRHAMLESSTVDADDAKFFLVACSAFVNYLIAKSSAGSAVGS